MLQIYAWGTMLAGYSQESGILQGARETFSGERPCSLCCKISAAKENDLDRETPLLPERTRSLKFLQEMAPGETQRLAPPRGVAIQSPGYCEVSNWCEEFISLPPTPPPRSVT